MKTPNTTYLNDYCPPNYRIHDVDLSFHLDAQKTRVIAKLTLEHNPLSAHKSHALTLLGEQLELIKISMEGGILTAQDYELTQESLRIYQLPSSKRFTLEIENFINPELNTALEGLYLSNDM
ncbi:MAG: aminopeptidase N, partial [Methylococcales bacterium]|nr:aminopeptidase N [Methylococcales bacterium]